MAGQGGFSPAGQLSQSDRASPSALDLVSSGAHSHTGRLGIVHAPPVLRFELPVNKGVENAGGRLLGVDAAADRSR